MESILTITSLIKNAPFDLGFMFPMTFCVRITISMAPHNKHLTIHLVDKMAPSNVISINHPHLGYGVVRLSSEREPIGDTIYTIGLENFAKNCKFTSYGKISISNLEIYVEAFGGTIRK